MRYIFYIRLMCMYMQDININIINYSFRFGIPDSGSLLLSRNWERESGNPERREIENYKYNSLKVMFLFFPFKLRMISYFIP